MTFSDLSYNLRIELDMQGCELTAVEIEDLEEDLHTLKNQVVDFPVSDLHITVVHHQRGGDFHVKTSLKLPSRTLFTGERDDSVQPAFESCIRKLTKKVRAYKQQMRVGTDVAKQTAGTKQEVHASGQLDLDMLVSAQRDGDYATFRRHLDLFEESLQERVARWLGRYPQIQTGGGHALSVDDVVEEVFLHAFDRFEDRPHSVAPGDWLTSMIDPSVQAILQAPQDEMVGISVSRSLA